MPSPDVNLNNAGQHHRETLKRNTRKEQERQEQHRRDANQKARNYDQPDTLDRIETQILIDGDPIASSEAARRRPGETSQQLRGRVINQARTRTDMHHDEPGEQIAP